MSYGTRRIVSQIKSPLWDQTICNSCLATLHRRHASSAATATVLEPDPPIHHTPPVTSSPYPSSSYQVNAGIVLSRAPLLTRDLTPFEKAFFLYQRRLNERLALPFTRYFYYQTDTPGDIEWKRKIKERLTPARDIGTYNAYGDEGWNDEVLLGARESEPEDQVEKLLKDADVPVSGTEEEQASKREKIEKPMPRVTEADKSGDVRSLNRALTRTLYLLVKGSEGHWNFPSGVLMGKEDLHMAAERVMVQAGGINMNTWIVGNAPVGHYNLTYSKPIVDEENKVERLGEKTFFMKARIMAGQANLKDNKFGLTDFRWLAKEEVQKQVHPKYWNSVRNMLAER